MEGQDVRQLEEVLQWAGTSYYPQVKCEGTVFTFAKANGKLVISVRRQDTEEVIRRQDLTKRSTLYEWLAEAKKRVQRPPLILPRLGRYFRDAVNPEEHLIHSHTCAGRTTRSRRRG